MLQVRDIMTTDVITLSPDASLLSAAQVFADRQVTGAPVIEGSKVVGVLSVSDLLEFSGFFAEAPAEGGEGIEPEDWAIRIGRADGDRDDEATAALAGGFFGDPTAFGAVAPDTTGEGTAYLAEHQVDELMTRKIYSVAPTERVAEAAKVMQRAGIHRLLVMHGGRLIGIVTTMDIARAVADNRLTTHTYVFNREADFEDR